MKLRTTIAATAVIGALLLSTSLFAGAIVSDKQPISVVPAWFPYGGCIEPVFLDGWIQTVTQSNSDGAGGLHYVSKATVHATGTGEWYRTQYRWNHTFKWVKTFPAGGAFQETIVQRSHLISLSGDVNGHIWWTLHFSVTPSGVPTYNWDILQIECF